MLQNITYFGCGGGSLISTNRMKSKLRFTQKHYLIMARNVKDAVVEQVLHRMLFLCELAWYKL